jgi:hypothetical protein
MVLDETDIVEYPGLASAYGNSAFLNVYPAAPNGNVGVLFGERVVLGTWIHRTSNWQDIAKTDEIFDLDPTNGTDNDLPTNHDLFDLYLGLWNGFGLRLTLSAGLDADDARTEPGDDELYTADGASTFTVDLMPGYSFDSGSYHGDFGVGITLSYFQVAFAGETAYSGGLIPSALLRHRSVIGPRDAVTAWVIDLTLTRRAYTAKAEGTGSVDGSFGHWYTMLVAGPRFKLPQNFTVWAGLTFELEHLSGKLDDVNQTALTGIGAPGAMLSGELLLWNILAIRAGVDYSINWNLVEVPLATDDEEIGSRSREMGQSFAWSTGLGVTLGNFQLDGTIRQALLFNGPDFIGGNAPGFVSMISALFAW